MPESNTLKIDVLSSPLMNTAVTSWWAQGISFAQLRYLTTVAGDENAPHFDPSQEPLEDGRTYTAKDNRRYYRPQLRVAQRAGDLPGPDVRFLKDAQGKVRLQFTLGESPMAGLPAEAEPFNVRVESVTLIWNETQRQIQRLFDRPTLVGTDNPQNGAQSNFVIRVGSELNTSNGEPNQLFLALSQANAGAYLQVVLSFGYWVDEPQPDPGNFGTSGVILDNVLISEMLPVASGAQPNLARSDEENWQLTKRKKFVDILGAERLERVAEAQQERQSQPNFRTAQLDRKLSFTFDPSLQANYPVYAALRDTSGLTDHWTDSPFGMVRTSTFPNTVFRLPDQIRLAFNREMGTPYFMPYLYRTDKGEIRVRVTLGAMPWHDPNKLVGLRDFLRKSSGGALSAPSVVTGGYETASLRLTSAFPEQIKALDQEGLAISLENGFQIILDLTEEFYRFLSELLTRENSPGLTGEVKVQLETKSVEGKADQHLERSVPVRLTFDDLSGLPLEVRVPPDALSPRQIEIMNLAPLDIDLGGCLPRLLQFDANSVAPLDVYEAAAAAVFPSTLTAQSTLKVDLNPKPDPSTGAEDPSWIWNAVQVELLGLNLSQSPHQVLDRIHEIYPNTSLAQKVTVESPFFRQATLPDKFTNLFRLNVKLTRNGVLAAQVSLSKEQPSVEVTLQRTLKEIVGEQASALANFKYQVQNLYYDHEGQWSAEKDGVGSAVFPYPNPPEND